jgi:Dyp-type peroxidase family
MRDRASNAASLPELLRQTITVADAVARLSDVQGNILRPHGRRYAAHLFLQFHDTGAALRQWLTNCARQLTSCATLLLSPAAAAPFAGLLLSAAGYRKLGLTPPAGSSYAAGMKRANLNDPPVNTWDEAFRQDLDALLILADNDQLRLAAAVEDCVAGLHVAHVCALEYGAELPGGIEHFGFVDGISQPLFLAEDIAAAQERNAHQLLWDPTTPLQVVLAPDPYGHHADSYGSYFVFRKLEQDVARFAQGVQAMAAQLGVSEELAGAMTVGRFKDGTPLALSRQPGLGAVNDFAYRDDPSGGQCPFASHVRRVNPRGELDYVAHAPDWENRIARRGIPYGQPGDAAVGLLFMCFQNDIARQFELIQNNWCNFPHFPMRRIGKDPLVGQRNSWDDSPGQRWSALTPDWLETDNATTFNFPDCVTMRGGEYFFAPSINFLRGLGAE